MSEIWKVLLGLSAGAVAYHFWQKRKENAHVNYVGERLPVSHLEEIQKNVHLYLDQLTEGSVSDEEIEKVVLELVK